MPAIPDATPRRTLLLGYGCALGVLLIWVGFSLFGRHAALGEGVRLTPWDLGAVRYLVAGVAAATLWLAGMGRGLPLGRSLVMGVVAGLCFPLPAYVGFTYAPAAHGAVILSGTLPFLVAVGSWFVFGERWSRTRIASLAVLLAGIVLLGTEAYLHGARPGARPGVSPGVWPGVWQGDLLFLASAIAWASYTILARLWGAAPLQAIVAVGLWCSALYLPVWWLALPSHLGAAPPGEVLSQALFQGVFATLISLFLFTRALAIIGTARLTTITALVPGLAGVLAIPLLGEPMGPLALAGLALVCGAVALGVRRG